MARRIPCMVLLAVALMGWRDSRWREIRNY
jgi:hypothetical protein